MQSETAIANAALTEVGGGSLTDLNADTTTHARIVQRWYSHARDATLRHYAWNFALARQRLAQDATGPDFEFTYSYSLPTNPYCLRALEIYNNLNKWKVEGRKLLTDATPVDLKYIKRVTDVAQFDDLFTEALIFRLAASIAFPVMRDKVMARELYATYLEKVQEARTTDSMEGTPDSIESNALIDIRRVGTVSPPIQSTVTSTPY